MAKSQVALAERPTLEILNEFIIDRDLGEAVKVGAEKEAEMRRLLKCLEHTVAYVPMSTEFGERGRAVEGFVTECVSLMFRERYPQVSGELLRLKRSINVSTAAGYDKVEGSVEIPVFVYAEFGKADQWESTYTVQDDTRNRRTELKLSSKMPVPTLDVREKAKKAIAYCHDLESKVLQMPVISDVLLAGVINGRKMPHPSAAEPYVLWKPKPSELKIEIKQIIDPDPILALAWQNRLYLVTTWHVAEEEPFMHYLREFKL